jgi:hypothetical protein
MGVTDLLVNTLAGTAAGIGVGFLSGGVGDAIAAYFL